MIKHVAGIAAATVFTVACMCLPFLPGRHDGLAVALSTMAQLFGVVGLLLVPIGVAWLIDESRKREPASREAYNVFFEQMSDRFGTREIVMYNKRDEHFMASHTVDLLRWTPEHLHARRGYYAVHDAPIPHWKYFWFD